MSGKTATPTGSALTDTEFFAPLVSAWQPQDDQSTHAAYTASDLMTAEGSATTGEDNTLHLSFTMNHRMALAVIEMPNTVKYKFTDERIPDYAVSPATTFSGIAQPLRVNDGTYRYLVNHATPAPTIEGHYDEGSKVKDTVRPTYALKNEMEAVDNGEKAVITAPMPLMPIYKGMPGASMLAEVLLQKYEYHVPFYRQVKQLEHLGVKLSRNTLDGWFRPVCELLRPLYLELRKKVLAADYLQVDETTLPVINHERHKAAKEYIWIVRAAVPRLLFFHYDNGSRSQKVAVRLLKNFKGYLQSDGHPIYDAFEDGEDVCLCGCLAHIRRHIELCKEENLEYAMQGLKFIQDMYNVE